MIDNSMQLSSHARGGRLTDIKARNRRTFQFAQWIYGCQINFACKARPELSNDASGKIFPGSG